MKMLPSMCRYSAKRQQASLICQIYGLYEVKLPGVDPVTVILQQNSLKINPGNQMLLEFDLKGSSLTRFTIPYNLLGKENSDQVDKSSTRNFLQRQPKPLRQFL